MTIKEGSHVEIVNGNCSNFSSILNIKIKEGTRGIVLNICAGIYRIGNGKLEFDVFSRDIKEIESEEKQGGLKMGKTKTKTSIPTLKEMIRKDLSNFKIKELYEVYNIDDDGRWCKSLGFFKSEKIAKGFAEIQIDSAYHEVQSKLVLTDGKIGFTFSSEHRPVLIVNEEESRLKIAKAAKTKLGPEMAAALGIS